MILVYEYTLILSSLLVQIEGSRENSKFSEKYSLESYCKSFKNCRECKNTMFECEWCNEIGCTSLPEIHCPKKVLLDDLWKKNSKGRYCTEIVSREPIFVPANVRRIIKLDIKVDDLRLYQHKVICEITIKRKTIRVSAYLDDSAAYCDFTILKTNQNVALGYLKLNWGGMDPFSNSVLVLTYNCHTLAQSCRDCLTLNKEYNCGWCKETNTCTLIEQCPRQYAAWKSGSMSCDNFQIYN